MPRFVILHHKLPDGEHWDLMLEHGNVLWTWRLDAKPTGPHTGPVRATRIGDHRKAYLTYEGPVSRNRGSVTRVEEGAYSLDRTCPDRLDVTFQGRGLVGAFSLPTGVQPGFFERAPNAGV